MNTITLYCIYNIKKYIHYNINNGNVQERRSKSIKLRNAVEFVISLK